MQWFYYICLYVCVLPLKFGCNTESLTLIYKIRCVIVYTGSQQLIGPDKRCCISVVFLALCQQTPY